MHARGWLIGLALFALVAGCAAGVQLARDSTQDPGGLLFNGYTKAEVDCFRCHNGDGRGARGPDLSAKVAAMPDEAILEVIAKGATFMPAYEDKTTAEERGQIVAWLRTSFGGPAAAQPAEAEEVKE